MADLTFKSSLSAEQIDDNFKNINLFDGIMAGLDEALKYEKGKKNAETDNSLVNKLLPDKTSRWGSEKL